MKRIAWAVLLGGMCIAVSAASQATPGRLGTGPLGAGASPPGSMPPPTPPSSPGFNPPGTNPPPPGFSPPQEAPSPPNPPGFVTPPGGPLPSPPGFVRRPARCRARPRRGRPPARRLSRSATLQRQPGGAARVREIRPPHSQGTARWAGSRVPPRPDQRTGRTPPTSRTQANTPRRLTSAATTNALV